MSAHLRLTNARRDPAWDAFVARVPGSHLQTAMWGEVKRPSRICPYRALVVRDGEIVAGTQLLARRVRGVGGVGYVPRGPLVADRHDLGPALAALDRLSHRLRLALVKVQPPSSAEAMVAMLERRGYSSSVLHNSPPLTLRVPLAGRDDEDLLAAMRSSTRANIRKAARRGVTVTAGSRDDLATFHALVSITARRHGFLAFGLPYYERMWDAFSAGGHVRLHIARRADGEPVSAALLVGFGDTATYKMGGWSEEAGRGQVNERMHFEGMRWARDTGRRYYDFDGIKLTPAELERAPEGFKERVADGVAWFKLGFGGELFALPGTFDLARSPALGAGLDALTPVLARQPTLVNRLAGRG